MQQADFEFGKDAVAELAVHLDRGLDFVLFVFMDDGIHDVCLMSGGDLLAHKVPNFGGALVGDAASDDGRASGREFVEYAEVEIAIEGKGECAGDWGCG